MRKRYMKRSTRLLTQSAEGRPTRQCTKMPKWSNPMRGTPRRCAARCVQGSASEMTASAPKLDSSFETR